VYYYDLSSFYQSKEWQEFRKVIIAERLNDKYQTICEHCGQPIIKAYDIIAHHKTELNLENVNDASISLNPDNIMLVHFRCHNTIQNRYGSYTRHKYIVYGSPLSGKSTYVKERAMQHDLVIDIDKIYECISNNPPYIKSGRLYDNMRSVYDVLIDNIKHNYGKWVNAFIIGGYPYNGERERLAQELGAELIYIDCTKEEALARLESCTDNRDKKEWEKYINDWYNRYSE
jgi:hypothetical protein